MGGVSSLLSDKTENVDQKYFATFLGRKEGYFLYGCDECGKEIVGDRYTCPECLNYDICVSCRRNKEHEHDLYLEVLHPQQIVDLISQSPSSGVALLKAFDLYAHRSAFGYRSDFSVSSARPLVSLESLPDYRWITFGEVGERVKNLARGLRGLIPPRTFVGICSHVQLAWYLADYACQVNSMIGPVLGPNYQLAHIEHIVKTTGMKLVFSSRSTLPLFLAAAASCPSLEYIIQLECLPPHLVHPHLAHARLSLQHWIDFNGSELSPPDFDLLSSFHPASTGFLGPLKPITYISQKIRKLTAVQVQEWKNTISLISRPAVLELADLEQLGAHMEDQELVTTMSGELETMVYTSGSTGVPKGAMFSGASWLAQVCPTQASPTVEKCISWTVSDRMNDIRHLCLGSAVGIFNGEMSHIFSDLAAVRPHQMNATPAFWNKIYAEFKAEFASRTAHLQREKKNGVVTLNQDIAGDLPVKGVEASDVVDNQAGFDVEERKEEEKLKIRKEVLGSFSGLLGGRCVRIVTGGAPTSPEVISFLWDCFNCRVAESYGTTESGAISTAGKFVKGLQWKLIAWENYSPEDKPYGRGELCVKREKVMMEGYFQNETETFQVLDSDGFYHTGDIVQLSPLGDGASIIDRKKNIFKLSQGEFVAPALIENLLLGFCPFIRQIFIYGHPLQPSLVAIIFPHFNRLRAHLQTHMDWKNDFNPKTLSDQQIALLPAASDFLLTECARIAHQQQLRPFETPAAIHLATSEFSVENGLFTQSEKPSRHALSKHFQHHIDAMYASLDSKRFQLKEIILDLIGTLHASSSSSDSYNPSKGPTASSSNHSSPNSTETTQSEGQENVSFVQLGGDSLTAIKLRNLIKRQLNVTIPVQMLLDSNSNVDSIANFVSSPFHEDHPILPSPLDITEVRRLGSLGTTGQNIQFKAAEIETKSNTVFLTGCPGFVGIALLCDLLNTTDLNVLVLIRPRQHQTSQNELFQLLVDRVLQSGLITSSNPSTVETCMRQRVTAVVGALDRTKFGLDEKEFEKLQMDVDLVIHAGAQVNSIMPYQRLSASNVEGTKTCIELCGLGKGKFFVFVSTTSVLGATPTRDESRLFPTDLRRMSGYAASKYIAELLVWQAIDLGLSASIVRPGFVGSASKSGYSNINDFDNRLLMGIAKHGKAPTSTYSNSLPGPCFPLNTLPVDYLASFIVATALNPEQSRGQCFNLENDDNALCVKSIVDSLSKIGFKMEEIPYEAWKSLEWDERNPIFAMKEEFFSQASFPSRTAMCSTKVAQSFMKRHLSAVWASIPVTDEAFVDQWISWLVDHHHLQLPNQ